MGKYVIGITGASGSIYGTRLINLLLEQGHYVFLTITKAGMEVLNQELNLDLLNLNSEAEINSELKKYFNLDDLSEKLQYFDINHIGASIASGSFRTDGMVILPCSMATVSAIAQGASNNLLERAADVVLKEKKRLVVVPRETPFNRIHLKNLLILAENDVRIVPASPAFYHNPKTIDELVNFLVGRILDQLDVEHNLFERWSGIE